MHSPQLVTATTNAIELALGADRPEHDEPLRVAMRRLCADARRSGMRSEELVVLLKLTWRARPELRVSRAHGSLVLDQVVTLCIQEYYRSGAIP